MTDDPMDYADGQLYQKLLHDNEEMRKLLTELIERYRNTSYNCWDGVFVTELALKAKKLLE